MFTFLILRVRRNIEITAFTRREGDDTADGYILSAIIMF